MKKEHLKRPSAKFKVVVANVLLVIRDDGSPLPFSSEAAKIVSGDSERGAGRYTIVNTIPVDLKTARLIAEECGDVGIFGRDEDLTARPT